MSFTYQREYATWIEEAKPAKTRARRIAEEEMAQRSYR